MTQIRYNYQTNTFVEDEQDELRVLTEAAPTISRKDEKTVTPAKSQGAAILLAVCGLLGSGFLALVALAGDYFRLLYLPALALLMPTILFTVSKEAISRPSGSASGTSILFVSLLVLGGIVGTCGLIS